jgi:hypothetical protein
MGSTTMITLQQTGETPIEFEGELINDWSNKLMNGVERTRFHEINLYSHDDGGYVYAINWISQWRGESNITVVGDCDTKEEFIKILEKINPIEHLKGYPKSDHYNAKQRSLEDLIKDDWRSLHGKIRSDLDIKKVLRRGKPSHPLGVCENPGWSIPERVRTSISSQSTIDEITPSELVTSILSKHFGLMK